MKNINLLYLLPVFLLVSHFKIYSMLIPASLKVNFLEDCRAENCPDGKVILFGSRTFTTWGDVVLIRYHPDGSIDTSFASCGYLTTSDGKSHFLRSHTLKIQDDEKILITSLADDNTHVQHRFHNNGTIDFSFGTGGVRK